MIRILLGQTERLVRLGVPKDVVSGVDAILWCQLDEARSYWVERGRKPNDLDFLDALP